MAQPVLLQPLIASSIECIISLNVQPEQHSFIASNQESLEDWRDNPNLNPIAIIAGEVIVGFAMFEESTASDGKVEINIFRLMIDRRYQGQGYGRKAMEALIKQHRSDQRQIRITTCFVPENSAARRMYASLGFVETGVDEDGEIQAELARL